MVEEGERLTSTWGSIVVADDLFLRGIVVVIVVVSLSVILSEVEVEVEVV